MSQEGSYRAPSSSPTELHCGQPTVALNTYRGCTACGEAFAIEKGKLRALDRPRGITVRWRDASDLTLVEHDWRGPLLIPALFLMFVGTLLFLWGGAVTAAWMGFIVGTPTMPSIETGLIVLGLGVGAVYLGAALLRRRTTIAVSRTHLELRPGPLSWRHSARVERSATDRVTVERVTAFDPPVQSRRRTVDRVVVERVLGNDAPTLPRPPIPERYQLHFSTEGRAPLILLEQLPSHATADQLRHLLDALLDATEGPRMRVEAPAADSVHTDVADDSDQPSARQKRTLY